MTLTPPTDVSFTDRPTDSPDLFLFGWDPGNVILAGSDNSITDCRRCTVVNGKNNTIGSSGRANGKYNTHIIGLNKTAQKNNILYIACSNGMNISGDVENKNGSTLNIGGDTLIGGDVYVIGDVICWSLSDLRLKTNRVSIKEPLKKINSIIPAQFQWNNLQSMYNGKDIGLIAQQVEQIIPTAVRQGKKGYLTIEYRKVIPLLVAAIREKQQKINELNLKLKFIKENI